MSNNPKNHGKHWTKKDVEKIKELANQGKTTVQIAKDLGRTDSAIRNKADEKKISLKAVD